MRLRLLFVTVMLTIVSAGSMSFTSRGALSIVLKTCEVAYKLSGTSFPCLKVVENAAPLSSYAVLREPAASERTIFSPLAVIAGIEDPELLDPTSPNYFYLAWNERSLAVPSETAWQNVGLAVNAAIFRTQDHLHIHMGCARPDVRSILSLADIDQNRFRRLRDRLEGQSYWARWIDASALAGENPVQLVADGIPGARRNMKGVTIGLFGAQSRGGEKGFYILANVMTSLPRRPAAAEELIDPKCRAD